MPSKSARDQKKRAAKESWSFPQRELSLSFAVFSLTASKKTLLRDILISFENPRLGIELTQTTDSLFSIDMKKETNKTGRKKAEKMNEQNHLLFFTLRSARKRPNVLSKNPCSSATSERRSNLPDLEKCPAPRSHLKMTGPRGLPSSRMRATH